VPRRRSWACALAAAALAAAAGCDLSGGEEASRPASLARPGADPPASSPAPRAGRAREAPTLAATVERVIDGDTIRVRSRGFQDTVRLIGIDTPETRHPGRPVECFGPQASARAARLLPPGRAVVLRADPTQDVRDRYGRLLAHVYTGGRAGAASVNRALVASGHARVYVYGGVRFRHAAAFEAAERAARRAGRGLWGPPCRGSVTAPPRAVPAAGCDPAYAGACVAPPPPDLDCRDIAERRFRSVGADPHRLDGDGNGIACERD
jgi:micrococcal nuclease